MAEIIAWVMVAAALAAMLAGVPVAMALGGAAALAGALALALGIGTVQPATLVDGLWAGIVADRTLAALPLFALAGAALVQSGLAGRARDALALALAGLPGGGAVLALVHGAALASVAGSPGTAIALAGTVAAPALESGGARARRLAGAIAAGGTLGALLPPSLLLVSLAHGLGLPVAALFFAAAAPALALLAGFVVLAVVGAARRAPAFVPERRGGRAWTLLAPLGLAFAALPALVLAGVLDTVTLGAAAAFAAVVAIFATGDDPAERRARCGRALGQAARFAAALFAILIGAFLFAGLFAQLDGPLAVQRLVRHLAIQPWIALLAALAILVALGAVFDVREIALFAVPLLGALFQGIDFGEHVSRADSALWTALLFALALQTGPLTPPFGLAFLTLKAAAPGAALRDLVAGAWPYALVQLGALGLVLVLPGLALWLPRQLVG